MILPSEKLGRITRFGEKFIVVHQPHLKILGEDILVTITSIPCGYHQSGIKSQNVVI